MAQSLILFPQHMQSTEEKEALKKWRKKDFSSELF